MAPDEVMEEAPNPDGTLQTEVAARVVKLDEAEYDDEPDEHTLCTWNSYRVDAVNPVTALDVEVEVVVSHVEDNVGLYLTL